MDGRIEDKPLFSAKFRHEAGLPLAEGVECVVACFPDHLAVTAMNQRFILAHEKVRGASVLVKKDVQRQCVPRLIGTRRKTVRTFTRRLVISYGDGPDGPGKSIIFLLGEWNVDKAKRIAALYKDRPLSQTEL